jgi:hypothetical protein
VYTLVVHIILYIIFLLHFIFRRDTLVIVQYLSRKVTTKHNITVGLVYSPTVPLVFRLEAIQTQKVTTKGLFVTGFAFALSLISDF